MHRNTITQFVFDRDLRLLECDYPNQGVWAQMNMKRGEGQLITDLYKYIPADCSEVADTMTDALNTVNKESQPIYRECALNLQSEHLFIMILVTLRENKLQMNCMVVDEQDVYSNRYKFSSQLLGEALEGTPMGISIRKYDELYNHNYFIPNKKLKELFDCTDSLECANQWSTDEDLEMDKKALELGGFYEYEKWVKSEDGTIKRWLTVYKQITNRGKMGYIIVTTYLDRTEKRKAEIQYMNTLKTIHLLSKLSKSLVFSYVVGGDTIELFGDEEKTVFTKSEFNFRHHVDTIHPDDREVYRQKINKLFTGELKSFSVDIRIDLLNKDNEYRYYNVVACATTNEEGKQMLVGMARDIQEEKDEEQKRENLMERNRLMYENMPVAVELYDENACLISVNKTDMEYFGLTPETVPIGSCLYDHIYLNDEQKEKIRRHEAFSMVMAYDFDQVKNRNFFKTKRQGVCYFDIRFTPLKKDDGSFYGFMSVTMDTTEMHHKNMQLEELSKNLDMAMEAGNMACWRYDPEKKVFITLKGRAMGNSGLTFEESLQLVHPDDYQKGIDSMEAVMSMKKKSDHQTYRYLRPDGTYRSYESYMTSNVVDGKVVSIMGTQRDVTNELKAQEDMHHLMQKIQNANNVLHEIVDNIPSALTIKDATDNFKFTTVNRHICELSGRTREELVGRSVYEFLDKDRADHYVNLDKEAIAKDRIVEHEDYLVLKGKETYWQSVQVPIKLNDGHTYIMDIYTDITSLKQSNLDLQKAKEKAEQSDKLKSQFLANMSHEIRTPLNAIVGFSGVLSSAETDAERDEYHKIIEKNSQQLLRLINDILDLSKIEAGTITIKNERIDALELISDAITTANYGLNGKPITMRRDIPYSECFIEFDKYRFNQILNNYLSNAVKYTEKGTITVSLECKENGVKVKVSDTGIGIAEENFNRVFGRFNKFDEFAQGTGLGLSICKAIADTIGGEVGFKSKLGEGTTFWVWIPCKVEAKALNEPKKRLPILIAEDDANNYQLIKIILREHTLVLAHNGKEAVDLMKSQKFAMALMDIRMPVMDGIEATKRIREFDDETPIVILTAYVNQKELALAAGCNDYMEKPVNKDSLNLIIEKYL